ncbi:MAG: hypothetical protein F6J94_29775 [Moorea sp. SIO1F2]|uniref:hypothetical protein n=1 Tax=unclassified Moorena TaxID=2683338 RepID=UPI0013B8B8C9|nr:MULTISPECIES: hypothetical protein [unclassified Moorena]NEP25608.1 hypothetical protein [Moorena sp. SIO3I6]NEQ84955.1 hypothetical protein [Moorena sp. SIO2I5]NET85926.1 hypothetical protein [Moorena sp. SIO1F2]
MLLIVVSGQWSAVSGQRSAVRAGGWNGHLGGMGILPVSFPTGCLNQALRGGKSGRALGWCVTGRAVPTLALGVEHDGKPAPNAPYAIPDSRFPIPDSLLPTPYSL